MRPGETVTVKDSKGCQLQRTVVQVIGNTVLICKQEEWFNAINENRDPICVGFPISSVVKPNSVKA
jgi:hypothetical protein